MFRSLHFLLPDMLAPDVDIFEARMHSVRDLAGKPGMATVTLLERLAGAMASGGHTQLQRMLWPLPEYVAIDGLIRILRRLLQHLVRFGCRDSARRLARAELEPPPKTLMKHFKEAMRDSSPAARWSTLGVLQPISRGELVVVLLSLAEPDASWDASLTKTLAAATSGGARGLIVHAYGIGSGAAVAAAEQRLEDALTRASANHTVVSALNAIITGAPRSNTSSSVLDAVLAGLAPGAEMTVDARVTVQLLSAATALENGSLDIAAADAARDAALATQQPGEASSAAVSVALERLEAAVAVAVAARARVASAEVLRSLVAEAAAADAARMSLAERLACTQRWEAALADAAGVDSAAAIALSRSLAHVRDAEALATRLTAAAASPASAEALAALRAALDDCAAAPPAVAGALVVELDAAQKRAMQWEPLLELEAAAACGDTARLQAAMAAAMAAGAGSGDIANAFASAMQQRTPLPPPPAAAPDAPAPAADSPMPREPGDWVRAGPRVWFDRDTVLGQGSRGTVVYAGLFLSERGKDSVPAAVKRVKRDPGAAGDAQLELLKREVDHLNKLKGPLICDLYCYHEEVDFLYVVFERCKRSLAQALEAARLPPADALDAFATVAAALVACHKAGYAHNDVHAGNVLITDEGRYKLTDVQLAVAARGQAQVYSMTTFRELGVQLNMARRAPEVLNGRQLTTAVDVWALGALGFLLLTGKQPFAPARQKQGGGGGTARKAAFQEDAAENKRIQDGAVEWAGLEAQRAGLRPRTALEARHLLAQMLAVRPELRPAMSAVRAHPLFWSAPDAAVNLRALYDRRPDEAALERAMESAGLRDAYLRLAGWRVTAHPPLLTAMSRGVPSKYSDGMAQLLRFARNAHEHPPGADAAALPRALLAGAGTEARRDAVMQHLLECWPQLPLAVHVCLAALPAAAK
jgi:serine/threonine protein kinase